VFEWELLNSFSRILTALLSKELLDDKSLVLGKVNSVSHLKSSELLVEFT
jgi:hypothetical protein